MFELFEDKLSERHLQILQAASLGNTYAQTAHELGLSERTIQHYAKRMLWLLDAHTIAHAVAKALRRGLIV